MVTGIESFKEWFKGNESQYAIIGGTACDILMTEEGLDFRATKDIDLVLIIEAVDAAFGRKFWDYVKQAGYEHCNKSSGMPQFYRFSHPMSNRYPAMIELFTRKLDAIQLPDDAVLTPLPMDEDISSLSAILLDDDYYEFLKQGKVTVDGVTVLDAAYLIPFKAKAWMDLTDRKEAGEHVDSKNILHPNKKRLALIMCPEEDSASVEWARQKDENWVNKDITSLEFVENIFKLMNWNRECRYKVLGRVANSDQGLCMLFDLEEAIMFTPKPQEYTDPLTGEMKKKQMKFFPDAYKNRIGKSYNDYIADHQMNMFEDFIGYQSSTVLDEPEREAGTTSIPIPQREESENIPSPDLPEQLENVQQSGNEIAERGMQT